MITGAPSCSANAITAWDVWQTTLHNPSFAAYAVISGALGIRVTAAAELDAALAHDGPSLVEVMCDPDLV